MLIFAVGCNLWVYRVEPTVQTDPNDNTFQYALVDRTNQIWDYANTNCSGLMKPFCMLSLLTDHWVPNWAEGYNLPYYYSHIPQVVIVSSYRLFSLLSPHASLFLYYHWITYLLLSFFPLALFAAFTVIGVSPITAGFGAIVATQISTDGLYGLDPSSFLWRGYGLTSQLYAMVFFPLALAYISKLFQSESNDREYIIWHSRFILPDIKTFILATLFLAATTAGHLGIGIIAFLSAGVIAMSPTVQSVLQNTWDREAWRRFQSDVLKLCILFTGVGLLLGYWILPILKDGNYHNTSVWDPIWKFDSYGYREILKNFFNGDLFDFHRFPTLTIFVIIGLFTGFLSAGRQAFLRTVTQRSNNKKLNDGMPDGDAKNVLPTSAQYFPFALLFVFWLLLYFGTTTWGSILYLIPGMRDFHISRFIVGVHMAGLFLIPIGFQWIITAMWRVGTKLLQLLTRRLTGLPEKVTEQENFAYAVGQVLLTIIIVFSIYPQTISYATYNDFLIKRGNTNYLKVQSDTELLLTTLRKYEAQKPGRVFAGRGGSWGKDFRVAETPYFMYLSTYGIPTVLWLPETWSPNSDIEQYFSENKAADYSLYNIRYVVTPANMSLDLIQPFWKPLTASKTWKLYEVTTEGYITTGIRPAIVSTAKDNYINVVRLWIQSDFPKNRLYPELTFDKNYPVSSGLPNFRMTDEVTYKVPGGSLHDLFAENPTYIAPTGEKFVSPSVSDQSDDHDMRFTATFTVPPNCVECLVVLGQSFHPSWRAAVDGKATDTFAVFPFFTAIEVTEPGTHTVVFSYQASPLKIVLLAVSILSLGGIVWWMRPKKMHNDPHKRQHE